MRLASATATPSGSARAGESGKSSITLAKISERPVEVVALVGRHQAGAKQRAARRDRG